MAITKEKNLLLIPMDNDRTYSLNITTGELVGVRNQVLRRPPAHMKEVFEKNHSSSALMYALFNFFRYQGYNNFLAYLGRVEVQKQLSVYERYDAIFHDTGYNYWDNIPSIASVNLVYDNFKDFLAYVRKAKAENTDSKSRCFYYIREFYNHYQELQTEKITSFLTPADREKPCYTQYKRFCDRYLQDANLTLEELKAIWYYYDTAEIDKFSSVMSGGYHYMLAWHLIDYSRKLEIKLDKQRDVMRYALTLEKAYKDRKDEIDNKGLTASYAKHPELTFENDDFIVILPTCVADIRKEGERQKNCVAGYAEKVASGREYIVFVRKKSNPDKNYITCQVYDDGTIGQYYRACNNGIDSIIDMPFKVAYAKHLSKNWKNS